MEKIQLNLQLTQEDIQTAISRYHYQDTDLPLFFQVYEEVRKYLDPKAIMCIPGRIGKNRKQDMEGGRGKAKKKPKKRPKKRPKKETGGRAEKKPGWPARRTT